MGLGRDLSDFATPPADAYPDDITRLCPNDYFGTQTEWASRAGGTHHCGMGRIPDSLLRLRAWRDGQENALIASNIQSMYSRPFDIFSSMSLVNDHYRIQTSCPSADQARAISTADMQTTREAMARQCEWGRLRMRERIAYCRALSVPGLTGAIDALEARMNELEPSRRSSPDSEMATPN